MSDRKHLVRDVIVDAPPEVVFAALTDWETQGQWMLGTRVWSEGPASGVGARINAFTGAGRVGFLDTMEITEWEPPRLVRVLHALTATPLDEGTEFFEPSTLQVTRIDVGKCACRHDE